MRRMIRRLSRVWACSVFACVSLFTLATLGFAQSTTPTNQYVYPLFNSQPGSEFVLNNFGNTAVTAEITLTDSSSATLVNTFQRIPAQSQQRFTTAAFNLPSFDGSLLITSNGPLGSVATLSDGMGHFETMAPAVASDTFYVPFGPATNGIMNLTIFNPGTSATSVLISVIGMDGSTLGIGQATLPSFGTFTTNINSLAQQTAFTQPAEISHVVVRALANVLGPAKYIYALGTLADFADDPQGIVGAHFDFALIPGVPPTSAATNALFPLFVQGGDYSTVVQLINPSGSAISATITLFDSNGGLRTSPGTVQIPANGSGRVGLPNLFNLPAGMLMGSLTITSQSPVIATEAIASVAQNGIALFAPAEPPNTNFAYRTRTTDPSIFTGLSFKNSNNVPANLTILNIPDDQSGVSSATLTIPPLALSSQTLQALMPEATSAGFVLVSSDSPISAQALEGKTDDSVLANLPAMHSQPGFVPPAATKFLITGTVTNNGVALAGADIQLSGSMTTSAITDASGNYQFPNTPPGTYLVRAVDPGYTMNPSSITVNIRAASSRGNNFAATLIAPTITAVQPSGVVAGSPDTQIVVAGGPFNRMSEIIFDGAPVATSLTSAGITVTVTTATGGTVSVVQNETVLQATIPAANLVAARVTNVVVENVGPGGFVTSAPQTFGIGSPAPTITQLIGVPVPLVVGNSGFQLTVVGTEFLPGSVILAQNTPLPTTFISSTQLSAFIPGSVLVNGGSLGITVMKPQPTIGPSNALTVALTSPAPGLLSVSPNSAEARLTETALPLQITVNGFGFVNNSIIEIDGTDISTTYVSSTVLTGEIPQTLMATARIAIVSVKNPDPTVPVFHFDNAFPLSIYNPIPLVTGIDASTLLFDPTPRFPNDTPSFPAVVVIHGSNFVPAGATYITFTPCLDKSGSFSINRVTSTLLIGTITIACSGTYSFGTVNPQPGGGISNLVSFTVSLYTPGAQGQTTPLVTGLSPAAVPAGTAPFTMTVSGSNFQSGAVVNFGTAVLIPATVTPNAIIVTVPAYLVQASGLSPVSVTNPGLSTAPFGGGNSNSVLFTIN